MRLSTSTVAEWAGASFARYTAVLNARDEAYADLCAAGVPARQLEILYPFEAKRYRDELHRLLAQGVRAEVVAGHLKATGLPAELARPIPHWLKPSIQRKPGLLSDLTPLELCAESTLLIGASLSALRRWPFEQELDAYTRNALALALGHFEERLPQVQADTAVLLRLLDAEA